MHWARGVAVATAYASRSPAPLVPMVHSITACVCCARAGSSFGGAQQVFPALSATVPGGACHPGRVCSSDVDVEHGRDDLQRGTLPDDAALACTGPQHRASQCCFVQRAGKCGGAPSVLGSQNAAAELWMPAPTFCSRWVLTARGTQGSSASTQARMRREYQMRHDAQALQARTDIFQRLVQRREPLEHTLLRRARAAGAQRLCALTGPTRESSVCASRSAPHAPRCCPSTPCTCSAEKRPRPRRPQPPKGRRSRARSAHSAMARLGLTGAVCADGQDVRHGASRAPL